MRIPSPTQIWRSRNHIALGLYFGVTGMIFINDNIVEVTNVQGRSMAPTLSPDYHETMRCDWVMFNKRLSSVQLRRGDVVHFMNPVRPDAFAVKRIVGLEGDMVVLDKRRRPRNKEGPELSEARAWDAWEGKVKVPQGHIWVEGDNWRETRDSNWYGPISKSLVVGRAAAIILPLDRSLTRPWVDFSSRTKVIEEKANTVQTDDLPVELAEIVEPHLR